MAVEQIKETDTLSQGRIKINAILDQSNASVETVNSYKDELTEGVKQAKDIAKTAGEEAKEIAETAGSLANQKADQAIADSKTAVDTSNRAVSTANQNKQEFDALRNEFEDLVAESGDSNPEIVQARTDTVGIKQPTLQARLTSDFNSRLTTADAMQMFSGAVNTPKMMDFKGKTTGNANGNPHQAFSDYTATTLKKPTANWNEFTQDNYNKIISRDDAGVSTGSTQNGVIPQQFYRMNIKAALESVADSIFDGMTATQVVKYIKDNFVSIKITIRGKASAPGNKNLKVATYLESTESYSIQMQNAATDYTDFTTEITDKNFIDSESMINILAFSDSSNGVTPASIDIDYIGVQITVMMNALDVLNKSGFTKKEYVDKISTALTAHEGNADNPHNVTKSQVGLEKVDNYPTAKQSDAEAGTDDNKFMTPLATTQQTNKRIATDSEALAGVDTTKLITPKNLKVFYDNQQKVAVANFTTSNVVTANKVTEASWRYRRMGNLVEVFARINLKAATDIFTFHKLPDGFKLSADFDDTTWNVPLSTAKAANATNFVANALVERAGTNSFLFSGNTSGNHYIHGSWYTDDPFPNG